MFHTSSQRSAQPITVNFKAAQEVQSALPRSAFIHFYHFNKVFFSVAKYALVSDGVKHIQKTYRETYPMPTPKSDVPFNT